MNELEKEYIKQQYQLDFLKGEQKILANELGKINDGISKREEQMDSLEKKVDELVHVMIDGGEESERKGVITQTLRNSKVISKMHTEMRVWKKAVGIAWGLITTLILGVWQIIKHYSK